MLTLDIICATLQWTPEVLQLFYAYFLMPILLDVIKERSTLLGLYAMQPIVFFVILDVFGFFFASFVIAVTLGSSTE